MLSSFSFNYLLPFFGAIFGMGAAFIVKPKSPIGLKLVLAFSGSFLLGITIFHLLPSIFKISNFDAGIWIAVGLIFQIFLEYLSEGAEHGHSSSNSKVKLPWVLFFSLCLHAFVEGIPMGTEEALVWGIFIHKIPIGMVLFLMISQVRISILMKILCLLLFATMSPAGSFILANSDGLDSWKNILIAIVIGMLLHIATTILFESNKDHVFNIKKLVVVLLGFGISNIL
ncbi:MAG: ZIP family metal transporter [Flavobacteriaceae bacterium]|nr:ZIP family metal transporter [Flavobacteriaceae bacterium]